MAAAVDFGTFSTKQPGDVTTHSRLELTDFLREHMRELRVAVAGLGALGGEVVRYLGMLEIGHVVLIDFDLVESANFPCSLLLRCGRPGLSKAIVTRDAVRSLFPSTDSHSFCCEISQVGFEVLRGVDLILSCLDSDWARLDVAYIARQLSVPVCDAGLGAPNYRHGRVSFFPKAATSACYSCLLSPGHRRELLLERDHSAGSCSRGSFADHDESPALPVTPMTASLVAALQVDCGLRELSRATNEAYTISVNFADAPSAERIIHRTTASCPFHELIAVRLPAGSQDAPRDLLRGQGRRKAILLDWPICTKSRCRACGFEWRPMQRTAVLRRRGVCGACGSTHVDPIETIDLIGTGSRWAATPFRDLGVPDRHLHAIVEVDG